VAQARGNHVALVVGQLPGTANLAGPLTPKTSLVGGRALSSRISAAWTWFFSRVRCLTGWRRR
jgi:hypothetical protein